jgi:hypothetical protein
MRTKARMVMTEIESLFQSPPPSPLIPSYAGAQRLPVLRNRRGCPAACRLVRFVSPQYF